MTDQLKEIGQRLASLREICDYTAEEMAEKLEISEAEYTSYEKGETDFSFSFLYTAAQALGVDILDIMSGDTPKLSICSVVKKGKGYAVNRNNAYDYRHLAFTFRNKKAEPFLVTVDPQGQMPKMHEHEGQEFNYVVSGKLMFYIGEVSYELNKGDSVYFDSGIAHTEKALGDKPAQFIAVVIK